MVGHQGSRSGSWSQLPAEVVDPPAKRVEETTSRMQRSNPLILKTDPCGGWPNRWWEFLLRLHPWSPGEGIALSDSEKPEALHDNLEVQF